MQLMRMVRCGLGTGEHRVDDHGSPNVGKVAPRIRCAKGLHPRALHVVAGLEVCTSAHLGLEIPIGGEGRVTHRLAACREDAAGHEDVACPFRSARDGAPRVDPHLTAPRT